MTEADHKLKSGKAAGSDGLMAEHLKFAEESAIIWSTNIMNGIVEFEVIPDIVKCGIIVPVYIGSGKDTMKMDSYHGITLTFMVAKVLEFLILGRMDVLLLEAGIPHMN